MILGGRIILSGGSVRTIRFNLLTFAEILKRLLASSFFVPFPETKCNFKRWTFRFVANTIQLHASFVAVPLDFAVMAVKKFGGNASTTMATIVTVSVDLLNCGHWGWLMAQFPLWLAAELD